MAKKQFFTEDNKPELAFISNREAITAPDENGQQTKYIYNTPERESKSKRMQILVKPSLYRELTERAAQLGTSRNDIINNAIEAFLTGSND